MVLIRVLSVYKCTPMHVLVVAVEASPEYKAELTDYSLFRNSFEIKVVMCSTRAI